MTYKGVETKGIEFYKLLLDSDEFTSELGKVTLASGKLEAELILFLKRRGIVGKFDKATLGTLIEIARKNKLINSNMRMALKEISIQRNYIMHNIYSLFIDLIDETILEKENLLDSDVHLYTERAWVLRKNIDGLADIIKNEK
jgi:hypothetical protein